MLDVRQKKKTQSQNEKQFHPFYQGKPANGE